MKTLQRIFVLGICALFMGSALANGPVINFDIGAQPLDRALTTFGHQSGLQIAFYPATIAEGMYSPDVRGSLTPVVALEQLLANTDLKYEFINERTIKISRKQLKTSDLASPSSKVEESSLNDEITQPSAKAHTRLAQSSVSAANREGDDNEHPSNAASTQGVPEILVKDSRILNMDIRRTRDDSQPYVVFDREAIDRSGAVNLEDFFNQRLPMNTQFVSNNQRATPSEGNASRINLRGLGANQTVILIDGHRAAGLAFQGTPQQPDINGIPLSAIERVEILPATASGIYGGSATGGVINVVLRRDYDGIDTELTYDNIFGGDASRRRINMSAGFSLEEGKSSLILAGSYADQDPLLAGDRSFTSEYLAESYAVSPAMVVGRNGFFPVMGGTPNICSAISFGSSGFCAHALGSNIPLTLKNGTALGSAITSVPIGYAGPGIGGANDGGMAFVSQAGSYNLSQSQTAQRNGQGSGYGARNSLLSGTRVKSLSATIRRDFTSQVRAFIDAGVSDNYLATPFGVALNFLLPATSPANPFQQNVLVTVPTAAVESSITARNSDLRLVGGVIIDLPREWRGGLDLTWNRTKFRNEVPAGLSASASTAVSNGTLSVFRDTNAFPLDLSGFLAPDDSITSPQETTLKDATLRLAGPIGSMPGGSPQLTLLLESRESVQGEGISYLNAPAFNFSQTTLYPERSQSVDSAYAEVRVPLVSSSNPLPGVRELEFQLSGRHDRYTTHGVTGSITWSGNPEMRPASLADPARATNKVDSTDATVSFRWQLIEDLGVRASYGTGFLPPNTNQLITQNSRFLFGPNNLATNLLIDPRRGNTSVTTGDRLSGGNANLQPEESDSWSTGLILTPRLIPGLRWSIDYVSIKKENNIASFPGGLQALLNAENQFPGRVTRADPTPAEQALGWAGPITQLDATLFNIAQARVEAFDTQLDYQLNTELGRWSFFLVGTYQPHYRTATAAGLPELENVDFYNGALEFKGNAGISWNRGPLSLGWSTRYFHSYYAYPAGTPDSNISQLYVDNGQGPNLIIPSQIYHDINASYRLDKRLNGTPLSKLLSGVEVQLGIRNVFSKDPPRYLQEYSTFGDPRVASYWISVAAEFGL